jgi:ribosomal protein S7
MLYKKRVIPKIKLIVFWNKDILFDYIWINKFVNQCIWQGKKNKIEIYFYKCLKLLKGVTTSLVLYFFEALFLIKPIILLRWLRLGRKWHQVARPIHEELQYRMGFFLLSRIFRLKNKKLLKKPYEKLFDDLVSLIHDRRSKLLDFKNDLYNIAIFNRSLFRFKW